MVTEPGRYYLNYNKSELKQRVVILHDWVGS